MTDLSVVNGEVAPGFEFVRDQLVEGTRGRNEFGVQLCIRVHGEVVVDLIAGDRFTHGSLTGLYSVSKAVGAFVLARLIDEGSLSLDQQVGDIWPEFAAHGKERVTVGQLLAHRAGLPVVEQLVPFAEVVNSAPLAARLAGQMPLWHPDTAFGYHAFTLGPLMEEIVRRVTGRELREYYEQHIREPRAADVFLGLPEAEDHRYVPLTSIPPTPKRQAELDVAAHGDPVSQLAFANIDAGPDLSDTGISTNNPRVRRAGPVAIGGVGSARGLARLFADALPGATTPIATQETFAAMRQMRSWGHDRVLDFTNAFGAVFLLPQPRLPFGSIHAFGHDGAGGALAFADPITGVSFGFIPAPFQQPGGVDELAVDIARRVRDHLL